MPYKTTPTWTGRPMDGVGAGARVSILLYDTLGQTFGKNAFSLRLTFNERSYDVTRKRRRSGKASSSNGTDNITRLIYALVIVVIVLSLIGASQGTIDFVVKLFVSAIAGAVTSLVAGTIIEAFTGDVLKAIIIPIRIGDFEFSVSLFFVATLILKFLIFR